MPMIPPSTDPFDDGAPVTRFDPSYLAEQAAEHLAGVSGRRAHDVAVILGTGLADAAASIGSISSRHDFASSPGFPLSVVPHQRPEVWSLAVGDRRVLAFLGRLHLYEGYNAVEVAHPVRTAAAAGCRFLIITNASGSLRSESSPGDLVLIADHLNLTGESPLVGLPIGPAHPTPYVDLVDAWSPRLRNLAAEVAPALREGVYAQVRGPHFETPAEIRMLRTMGADLVGMSSALEAIAARQLGVELLGLSLVTNMAAGMGPGGVSPDSVISAGRRRAKDAGRIIREVILGLT
jgi:purine-nucleoside phosphorylase